MGSRGQREGDQARSREKRQRARSVEVRRYRARSGQIARLENVGVRDGEDTASDGVRPHRDARDGDADVGRAEAEDVADDLAKADLQPAGSAALADPHKIQERWGSVAVGSGGAPGWSRRGR